MHMYMFLTLYMVAYSVPCKQDELGQLNMQDIYVEMQLKLSHMSTYIIISHIDIHVLHVYIDVLIAC